MKIEEILQLVDSVSKSALAEFKYEEGGVKLSLKKAAVCTQAPVSIAAAPAPAVQSETATNASAPVAAVETPEEKNAGGKIIKSPLVGTFYAAPSEEAEPYISVGDSIKEGQVVAIVEAMKLMNEIESDFSGKVAEILVQNGDTVEYGQPLFVIK